MAHISDAATAGFLPWRKAMSRALYGPDGFYRAAGQDGPTGHFRTSPHVSPQFGTALWQIVAQADTALGHPDRLDVVDMAAGGGELLAVLHRISSGPVSSVRLEQRIRLVGVEIAPRPAGLDSAIGWKHELDELTGVLIANEWLDNVPLDVAELDDDGIVRTVTVDPETGAQRLGEPVDGQDADWMRRWWPLLQAGDRAEIGHPRDTAWAGAVAAVRAGLALTIDYGHVVDDRPPLGSMTGYRAGAQVPPIPDGSRDITAAVAVDSAAAAGRSAQPNDTAPPALLVRQRTALKALGVTGARPPRELATRNPGAYLAALGRAGEAAELIGPNGLGRFWWLAQSVGLSAPRHRELAQRLGVTSDVPEWSGE